MERQEETQEKRVAARPFLGRSQRRQGVEPLFGHLTNNVAEYERLVMGFEALLQMGAKKDKFRAIPIAGAPTQ